MVTKRQGRHPEGLEKERKKEEAGMLSYAHTCTLRERFRREGSLLRIWNAPVKQVHTRFLSFPPSFSSLEALVYT